MVVVDTNVLVYFLIENSKTTLAKNLRNRDPNWILPELWRHEFLKVLATFAKTKKIKMSNLIEVWEKAFALFSPCELQIDFIAALQAASNLNISGYDAQFLILAQQKNTVLITDDQALHRKTPTWTLPLTDFV